MRNVLIAALAAGLIGGVSYAPASSASSDESASGRQCFVASMVRSFSSEDDRSIIVHVSRRASYELTPVTNCQDVDGIHQVGLRTLSGAASLCVGQEAELFMRPRNGSSGQCRVEVTRRLPAAPSDEAQSN